MLAALVAVERIDICTAAAVDSAAAECTDTAGRADAAVAESQVALEERQAVHSAVATESPGPAVVEAGGSLARSAEATAQSALGGRSVRRQSWLRASTVRLTSGHRSSLTIPPVREGFKQAVSCQQCLYPLWPKQLATRWRNTRVPLLRRAHRPRAAIRLKRTGRTAVDWNRNVPLRRCSAREHARNQHPAGVRVSSMWRATSTAPRCRACGIALTQVPNGWPGGSGGADPHMRTASQVSPCGATRQGFMPGRSADIVLQNAGFGRTGG